MRIEIKQALSEIEQVIERRLYINKEPKEYEDDLIEIMFNIGGVLTAYEE